MSIEVNCTKCGAKFNAPDRSAGKSGKCPKCQAPIQVPAAKNVPTAENENAEDEFGLLGSAGDSPLGDLSVDDLMSGEALPTAGTLATPEAEEPPKSEKKRKKKKSQMKISDWVIVGVAGIQLVFLLCIFTEASEDPTSFVPILLIEWMVGLLVIFVSALWVGSLMTKNGFAEPDMVWCGFLFLFPLFVLAAVFYVVTEWKKAADARAALALGILSAGGAALGAMIIYLQVGTLPMGAGPPPVAQGSPRGGYQGPRPTGSSDMRPSYANSPSRPRPADPPETVSLFTPVSDSSPSLPVSDRDDTTASPDDSSKVVAALLGAAKQATSQTPPEAATWDPLPAPVPQRSIAFRKAVTGAKYIKNGTYSFREALVCLIAGDGSALKESMHWFPAQKRPVVGQRWGIVLYATRSSQQPGATHGDLETGGFAVAKLYRELTKRLSKGPNGYWPRPQLGKGFAADLLPPQSFGKALTLAQSRKLDYLLYFEMVGSKVFGSEQIYTTTQARLYDVASKKILWTSPRPKPRNPRMGPTRLDTEVFQPMLQKIDSDLSLGAMPALTPQQVNGRIGVLLASPRETRDDALPVLAEIRYYQAAGLLSDEHANVAYGRLLDADAATAMAGADPEQRYSELRRWLNAEN